MEKRSENQVITTSHNPFYLEIEVLPKRGRYSYPPMSADEVICYLATVLESYPDYKQLQNSLKSMFSKANSEKLEYLIQNGYEIYNIKIPEIALSILETEAIREGSRDGDVRTPLIFLKEALNLLIKKEDEKLNKLSQKNLVLIKELLEPGVCHINSLGKATTDAYLTLLQSCFGSNLKFDQLIKDDNIRFDIVLETILNTPSFSQEQHMLAKAIVCISRIFGLQNVFQGTKQ